MAGRGGHGAAAAAVAVLAWCARVASATSEPRASATFPLGYGATGYGAGMGYGATGYGTGMGYLSGGGGGEFGGGALQTVFGGGQAGAGLQQKSSSYLGAAGGGGQAANSRGQHDVGHYGATGGANNNFLRAGAVEGGAAYGLSGASKGEAKIADQRKKGHSTKGFQNFHHKDETGKSSTFFDESSDEGEAVDFRGHSGQYGDARGASFSDGAVDTAYRSGQGGTRGGYDAGAAAAAAQGHEGARSAQQRYGGEGAYGQRRAYDSYGNEGATAAGRDYGAQQQFGTGFHKGAGYGGTDVANYGGYVV